MSKLHLGDPFEHTIVNVFNVNTHEIIFTGNMTQTAKYLNTSVSHIAKTIKRKHRINKIYTVRRTKQ